MIWRLIYELEYWITIGIGDDILNAEQRPEYSALVEKCKKDCIPPEKIPSKVFLLLKEEAKLPFYKSPTFWRLIGLWFKKLLK